MKKVPGYAPDQFYDKSFGVNLVNMICLSLSHADGVAFEQAASENKGAMSMKLAKWIKEAAAIRETGNWLDGKHATDTECKDARSGDIVRA